MPRLRHYLYRVIDTWFEMFWEMPFLGRFWLMVVTLLLLGGVVTMPWTIVRLF